MADAAGLKVFEIVPPPEHTKLIMTTIIRSDVVACVGK